eukprot:g2613.t1
MATTLAESFLQDLGDFEGGSDDSEEDEMEDEVSGRVAEGDREKEEERAGVEVDADEETQRFRDVGKLRNSKVFLKHMEKVRQSSGTCFVEFYNVDEFDPEYQLVLKSNETITAIQEEIQSVHDFLADTYKEKFPELVRLLPDPLQYAKVVKCIGNETDMTLVDFGNHIAQTQKLIVTVTGSSAIGRKLSPRKLRRALAAAEEISNLEKSRIELLRFVESRMHALAPNTSALLGTMVTARLLGHVGGIRALSRVPSCNLQVLGQRDASELAGFSSKSTSKHMGLIASCPLIANAPAHLQRKLCRWVAGKVALAVRADTCGGGEDRSGNIGQTFRAKLETRIEKALAPSKEKTKKALPAPDSKPKRKRGGKRVRRFKEKFAMTQMRKEQNRMVFDDRTDEYGDSAMGKTLGALGKGGSAGSLRILKETKRRKVQSKKKVNGGSGVATSGLSSSLAFTPVQGIELPDPEALKRRMAERVDAANASYFSEDAAFSSAN